MLTVSESLHIGVWNISSFVSFLLASTRFKHLVSHGLLVVEIYLVCFPGGWHSSYFHKEKIFNFLDLGNPKF